MTAPNCECDAVLVQTFTCDKCDELFLFSLQQSKGKGVQVVFEASIVFLCLIMLVALNGFLFVSSKPLCSQEADANVLVTPFQLSKD